MTPQQQAQAELARRELERRRAGVPQQQRTSQGPAWREALIAANPAANGLLVLDRLRDQDSRAGAIASGFDDGLTFGWGDELAGLQAGAFSALGGGQFSDAYTAERDRRRELLAEHQQARPVSTGGGQLAGSIASSFLPGGLVTRGTSAAGRIGVAAGVGAGAGGLYGAGSGETNEERLNLGLQGAGWGALAGLGGQAVLGELAPAGFRAVRQSMGLPSSSRVGPAEQAFDDLVTVARQSGQGVRTADDAARIIDEAAQRDPALTTAEAFRQAGRDRLAYLARAPGETGDMVEEAMRSRALNQTQELEQAFLGRAPGTAAQLEEGLDEAWRTRGAELYNPILSAPPAREHLRAFVQFRNSPAFQHRGIQAAWRQADGLIQDDIANGRIPASAAGNLRYRLHYTKLAMDTMIRDPSTLDRGLRNISNASLVAAQRNLLNAIERVTPGYTVARGELADIESARRALQAGQNAFNRATFRRNEDLQRYVQSLPASERAFFLAGQEEAIAQRIMQGGRDGKRNVANALLDDLFQQRLRIIHGRDADAMIQAARNVGQRFEFGQRVRPSTGSITSNMLFQTAGGGVGGAAIGYAANPSDPLAGAVQGGVVGLATGRLAPMAWNRLAGPAQERFRNALGRAYLTPVGEYRQATRGLLSRARREMERRRLEATRNAVYAGVGSGGIVDGREQ